MCGLSPVCIFIFREKLQESLKPWSHNYTCVVYHKYEFSCVKKDVLSGQTLAHINILFTNVESLCFIFMPELKPSVLGQSEA